MALLTWYDSFSVGIEKIDDQHKKFFDLINKAYSAMENSNGTETIGGVLNELREYVVYHFETEESWMEACSYPDIEIHKQEHRYAVKRAVELLMQYEEIKKDVIFDLLKFLGDWIINHILESDIDYIPYVKDKI
jgi:hemerythrin